MHQPAYPHDFAYPIDQLRAGETVLGRFPVLATNPVLAEHGTGDGDALLRFAFFFADKGSGLQRAVSDLDRKKREALRLAGIGECDPRHAEVLTWRNRTAVRLCNQVIQLCNDLDYAIWWHMGLGLYDSAEQVSARIDATADLVVPPTNAGQKANLDYALGMDEDKKMRTFTLRHKLIDDLCRQRGAYRALTNELFMSDEELAAASERERLAGAGAVGARAAQQNFVTPKKTISS